MILIYVYNASGFDNWVVFNSLDEEITNLKMIRTAKGLLSLSFRCGDKIFNIVVVPQYVKLT